MDELSISFNRLNHLGIDIRNLLRSLKTGNSDHFSESLNITMNKFDLAFVGIQSLLPYFIQVPTETQKKVFENVKNAYKIKKDKDLIRYEKEIEQYSQRFQAINEKIAQKTQEYNEKARSFRDEFEDKLKKLDCKYVDGKILRNSRYNEKMSKIDKILENIKQDQRKTIEKEEQPVKEC